MIIVSALPADPTWPIVSAPGRGLVFLSWEPGSDVEGGPPDQVAVAVAAALVARGSIVFLGAVSAGPSSADWTRVGPEHWVAWPRSGAKLRRLGAGPKLPLTWTSSAELARRLFDQPSFAWTQRGQCVFLFPGDQPNWVDPATIPIALAREPPEPLPPTCLGTARPGTDGDFVELALFDGDRKQAVLASLSPKDPID